MSSIRIVGVAAAVSLLLLQSASLTDADAPAVAADQSIAVFAAVVADAADLEL